MCQQGSQESREQPRSQAVQNPPSDAVSPGVKGDKSYSTLPSIAVVPANAVKAVIAGTIGIQSDSVSASSQEKI
jgi:hypothetical protein